MTKSKIEWTEYTYNPVIGCTKVPVNGSLQKSGCFNCYAEMQHRIRRGNDMIPDYDQPFSEVKILPHRLGEPTKWKTPGKVFTCSMSDLFNEQVPLHFIGNVFAQSFYPADWHIFQILTKRPQVVKAFEEYFIKHMYTDYSKEDIWKEHMWLGTSVASQETIDDEHRIDHLLDTHAKIKWLSCEPLVEAIDLTPYLDGIDWVVVGGETIYGRKKSRLREMKEEWAIDVMNQCKDSGTPFFFKQHGNRIDPETNKIQHKDDLGRELLGEIREEYPVYLEVVE